MWWWLPAFIAAAFVLYWPVLQLTPFSDDHSALWNSGIRGIPWRNGFFRPLSDLSFRIGYLIGGTDVAMHRSFNVLVHGLNAFLLFLLCRQWSFAAGAFFAGVLFLVYPFHQESIVWLVGRESAMGTSAILLGLVVAGSGLPLLLRLLLMAGMLILGGLCYESALLLLPLSWAIAWSRLRPRWPRVRPIIIALGTATLVYGLLRFSSVGSGGDSYVRHLLPSDVSTLLVRIPKAVARLFLPPEYDTSVQLIRFGSLMVMLIVLAAALRMKMFAAVRGHIVLWTILTLVACSIAMFAGVSTVTSESDRFLYLPSAFLCGSFGLVISRIRWSAIRWGALALLVASGLWQTSLGHANWHVASLITQRCIDLLPAIPEHGRLWVSGLPSDHHGAFIFRNGFPEAMDLNGRNGSRIIVVPPDTSLQHILDAGLDFRGAHRTWNAADHWCGWTGNDYTSRPTE